MTPRSQQPNNSPEAKKMSQLYDDALPEQLQYEGILDDRDSIPRINNEKNTPLSPYIIKLKHADTREETQMSAIDALAKQLGEDVRVFEEEFDPLAEDELEVNFNDLVMQLREPERHVSAKSFPKAQQESFHVERSFSIAPTETSDLKKQDLYDLLGHAENTDLLTDDTDINENEDDWVVPTEEFKEKRKINLLFFLPDLKAHQRAIAVFTVLSFALVLPLQAMQSVSQLRYEGDEITDVSKNAIDTFLNGTSALSDERFDVAETEFARASENFMEAEDSLGSMNASIMSILSILPQTNKTYDSASGLLAAGKELSIAAEHLAGAADELESHDSLNIVTKLSILESYVERAQPNVQAAVEALEDVDASVVPEEYKTVVEEMQTRVPQIAVSMNEFIAMSETLSMILGENRTMRYLVTFQNNTELRPTGGFVGSFAEIDLLNGEIDAMYVPEGGTYDLQGQLSEFVASPHPLSLINPRWEFHDSNYFPDFPTSSQKMIWFYENAGGPTVDGVIAINATFMPELLEILGPVEMPEYGRTIDSENFMFETQKIVEIEYETYQINDEEREVEAPKQFIGDLAPKVLERMEDADTETMLAVLDLLGRGLTEKDVMIYFESNALQSTVEELGWTGSIKQTTGDFLMVTHTNLGGGKTDTVIDQDIYVDTVVQDDGSIINTVTITKEHRGLSSALFEGANNVDYIRLYVPRGSELLSASGFEIPDDQLFKTSDLPLDYDEDLALLMTDIRKDVDSKTDIWTENGKTVFGNWMQTAPGEVETITFTYKLPFSLSDQNEEQTLFEIAKERLGFRDIESYTLLVQKQPGVNTRETYVTLTLPDNKSIVWSSHDAVETVISNDRDELIQFVIESK